MVTITSTFDKQVKRQWADAADADADADELVPS